MATALCQKHTTAVVKAGYSLEVLHVVPVVTVDPTAQPSGNAAATTSPWNGEPVPVLPASPPKLEIRSDSATLNPMVARRQKAVRRPRAKQKNWGSSR